MLWSSGVGGYNWWGFVDVLRNLMGNLGPLWAVFLATWSVGIRSAHPKVNNPGYCRLERPLVEPVDWANYSETGRLFQLPNYRVRQYPLGHPLRHELGSF